MIVGSTLPAAAPAADDTTARPSAAVGLSPRLRLARLARDTTLRVGGVLALDTGGDGRFAVVSGEERIDGLLCTATPEGGYDVALRVVCALVPLGALGERVREAVRETATAAGLPLATVSVHVTDVAAVGTSGGL